tara:strand:- start:489 stop:1502 length:1014 start_codon:yes stop_codon:yes gene_type:complete
MASPTTNVVYPVQVSKGNTLYIEAHGSKAARNNIQKQLRSLGYKKFTITKPIPLKDFKNMSSKVKTIKLKPAIGNLKGVPKPPAQAGLGKIPGGPNNPGMKISEGASATKGTKKQKIVTKSGGSSNQNVSLSKFKEKLKSKEIKKPKPLTADKKESIVNKVKKKNKNVPKSRILGWIKNNPVKAAAGGAGIVGLIIGALGYALTPTPTADATLGVTTSSKTQKKPKGGLRKGKKTTLVKKKTVPLGPNRPKSTVKKSSTPKTTKKPVDPKVQKATPSTFGEAFKQARKEGKKSFTFKGKSYAAVTMDEVKKKGHKTLQSYLNAKGKPKKLKKDIKER